MGRLLGQREQRQWAPEPPIPPFPGTSVFGQPSLAANPESALAIPTVWACVKLLADTVSCMSLQTFRKTDGVPARITDPTVVLNPTADMTQSEWLHMLMVSLLLRGNAYGLIASRDMLGRPSQIVLLNPDQVQVNVDQTTGVVTYLLGPQRVDRTPDMWHVRGMTLPGKKIGLSPIAYAQAVLNVDGAARKFGTDYYNGGGVPKATIESDLVIDQDQAATIKAKVTAATLNREPLVLGEGLKWSPLSVKAEESQFLETQGFNIAQIARFYSVPAEMVGGNTGSSMTYSTVELNSLNFLTYGCQFWLKRIEDAYFPVLPQPQFVQFDVNQLLRTDMLTDIRSDAIKIAAKIQAPSEIRTKRNLAPFTDEQKEELELVPLTINPSTGEPKALPNPGTPATSDDTPVVGTPPPVPKVA